MNERATIDSAIAVLKTAIDVLTDVRARIGATARVVFVSPVTGQVGTANCPYGGDWFDATGYARLYNSSGTAGYHSGADLNRPNYRDSGAAVFAAAAGRVVFDGRVPGWQGEVVVIEHRLEDGAFIWTRYAHIVRNLTMVNGQVERGQSLGVIADYNLDGAKGDHLHFDVARIDLGARPGDWPGMDRARLLADYIDPAAWLLERRI